MLVSRSLVHDGRIPVFALLIYGFSLVLMFAGSAAYHRAMGKPWRPGLRKFDHAAIYLLIAGTYTPLMLCRGMGNASVVILGVNWCLALTGILTELFSWKIFPRFSLILYLIMGWLCVMVFPAMWQNFSALALGLLVVGGVLYTAGVAFYTSSKKFYHMIWHFWVLGGAICHFAAVWFVVA